MLTVNLNTDGCTGHILIEPNRPISWQDNMCFIKWFALLSLLTGSLFTYLGFILVLPFSGLQVIALAAALYLVYKHYTICQVIYFTDSSVIIESGNKSADEHIKYQRYWSKFHIEKNGRLSIPRLTIQSKGRSTEIGNFLNFDDKMQLIELIRQLTVCFQVHSH